MNWNLLLALAPVLAKYGPALIALYQADEPLALQLIADLKPVFATPSLATILPLLTKWGPQLVALVQKQGTQVQTFISDVEAAINSAGGVAAASGVGAASSLQSILANLPIPITLPGAPALVVPSASGPLPTGGFTS
jgi:hypothetical protein